MKIVSLNTWGGKLYEPLVAFIKKESETTDIFCFQEIFSSPESHIEEKYRSDLFARLCELLPGFSGFFAPMMDGYGMGGRVDYPISFGIAMFVRKSIHVKYHGDLFVYGTRNLDTVDGDFPRNVQYALIDDHGKDVWIMNFHGFHNEHKNDTDERLEQSRRLVEFVREKQNVVLCGDFNLKPDTRSITMISEAMRNLITEHNITTTRSEHYKKPDRFADFTFVKGIDVKRFSVPQIVVSDHLPMIVEW